MGTKKVNENGPNPFFGGGDQKHGRSQSYDNDFVLSWFRQLV